MMPADFSGMHVLYSAETLEVLLNKITSALASMKNTPLVTLKQKTAKVGFAVSAIASSCCLPHTSGPCIWYRMRRRWDGVGCETADTHIVGGGIVSCVAEA